MAHAHHHHHHHHHATGRKLGVSFGLSFLVLAVLGVGGWMANSLALLADAGHVVTDIAALGLSWYATRQAARPASATRTFGYHRTGILAALINAVSLILVAGWICFEAYERFWTPYQVNSGVMMVAAAIGLVINLGIGLWLKDESEHNLNVHSAFLHVIGDAAASAGVIVGAAVIWLTGWHFVDPLLSVAIALFIAYGAWQVVDESVSILMEGAPSDLDIAALQRDLEGIEGVRAIHDLHVWSIARGMASLSCHVIIDDEHIPHSLALVARCNMLLADKYHIVHTTLQAEAEHCSPDSPSCNFSLTQASGHSHMDDPDHDHAHDHDHGHPHSH